MSVIIPVEEITKVVLATPIYCFPYMDFSTQTPKDSAI
jgi:hypothetical protein